MRLGRHALAWPLRLYRAARLRIARAQGEARMREVRQRIVAGGALEGKIVVITGAGAGIGRATATAFARAGAHCILVEINREEGNAVLAALTAEGLRAELIVTDVSDDEQVASAAAQIAAKHQRVDILVNNAGVRPEADQQSKAGSIGDEIINTTLAVNLYGPIHMSRALAPLIPSGGRIINVSSVMGLSSHRADGYSTAYRLSKAALNSYTRSLAFELNSRGVMVDCIHPGWVKTPLGGPGAKIQPHEATDTAFYLATREPSTMTGLFWQDCVPQPW